MNQTTHIAYRGEYYEVTYAPDGDILEVLLLSDGSGPGEVLPYYTLPEKLQDLIQEAIND